MSNKDLTHKSVSISEAPDQIIGPQEQKDASQKLIQESRVRASELSNNGRNICCINNHIEADPSVSQDPVDNKSAHKSKTHKSSR